MKKTRVMTKHIGLRLEANLHRDFVKAAARIRTKPSEWLRGQIRELVRKEDARQK